tara:strand:- start:9656 stop:10396 length:741 start_codon:yes stop_codon:yes gene_type:complete
MLKDDIHIFLSKNPKLGIIVYETIRHLKNIFDKKDMQVYENLKNLGFDPKVIFDVGANRGEWSRNVKTIFKNARYFLFEPQKEMEPFLKKFTDSYPESKYFNLALGEKKGNAKIGIWPGYYGTTLLHQGLNLKTRDVEVESINNLIKQNLIPAPDILKMDVQGFEMHILKGSTDCFKHTEVIILETYLYSVLNNQPILSEIVNYMNDNGYVIFDFTTFHRYKKSKVLRYFDTVFIKKDSKIRKKIA